MGNECEVCLNGEDDNKFRNQAYLNLAEDSKKHPTGKENLP